MAEDQTEQPKINRREFLERGAKALAGAALVGAGVRGEPQQRTTPKETEPATPPEFASFYWIIGEEELDVGHAGEPISLPEGINLQRRAGVFNKISSRGEGLRLSGVSEQTGSFFYTAGGPETEFGGASVHLGSSVLKTPDGLQYLEVGFDRSDPDFQQDNVSVRLQMRDGSEALFSLADAQAVKRWDRKAAAVFFRLGTSDTDLTLPKNVIPVMQNLEDIQSASVRLSGNLNGQPSYIEFTAARE